MLDAVRAGTLDADAAATRIREALAAAPFEDLGFARVDTHRHHRQGFPEVILGLGKTPSQIAAVAERIVARGHSLLVTRRQVTKALRPSGDMAMPAGLPPMAISATGFMSASDTMLSESPF